MIRTQILPCKQNEDQIRSIYHSYSTLCRQRFAFFLGTRMPTSFLGRRGLQGVYNGGLQPETLADGSW